ncbi:hypothetical protein BT96DRAFT_913411, partial [Gymnopus androsaceus JB14]
MGSPRTPQERVALTRNHDEIAERNRVIADLRDSMQAFVDDFQQSKYLEKTRSAAFQEHWPISVSDTASNTIPHSYTLSSPSSTTLNKSRREAERQGSRENGTGNPEHGNNPGGQQQRDVEKELEEVRALVARLEHERVAVAGGEDNGNGDNDDEPVLLQRMSSQRNPSLL